MASYRDLAGALEAVLRGINAENIRPSSALYAQASQLVAEARAGDLKETKWTAFVRAPGGRMSDSAIKDVAQKFGVSEDEARHIADIQTTTASLWVNSRYQVRMEVSIDGDMVYLSIKRLDQKPIRSYRDLQRIKNEMVGVENEGIELFPAESRLVDTANQYHLWVLTDPKARIPVGFKNRLVTDVMGLAEGQEPFEDE